MNLAIGVVLGLGVGCALAFFVEYMDDTVRAPEHVEQTIGVPVFALIPVIPGRSRS
jgi:capsular polysaccharide biosynthesis protein